VGSRRGFGSRRNRVGGVRKAGQQGGAQRCGRGERAPADKRLGFHGLLRNSHGSLPTRPALGGGPWLVAPWREKVQPWDEFFPALLPSSGPFWQKVFCCGRGRAYAT